MPVHPTHEAAINKFTATDHRGKPLNQVALLHPNPMVMRILMARAKSLSDDERAALKGVLTPETTPALKKLLPELSQLFDKGMSTNGG